MNKKDIEIVSYEISRIRQRLYSKYEEKYNIAAKQGDDIAALEICRKEQGMQELEAMIQDFLFVLMKGLDK